ncbi:MAG: hypothetical protein IKU25_02240 [Clostridia bacterium]|nr:hypothetical protein [Clostridia bacterium]
MKKIVSVVLVIMLVFICAACGTTDNTTTTTQHNQNQSGNNQGNEVAFENVLVADTDDCRIEIVGSEQDVLWGYTLKVKLENKSDKNYTFAVDDAVINGVQCDTIFAKDVAAGKKANDSIVFSDDDLEQNEIGQYTDIELTFRVYDSEDWTADDVLVKTVHVYPLGKEEAMMFDRGILPTDDVLVDNDYVTVLVTGYDESDFWGYGVKLFVINKTDTEVMFSADDVSVNGIMVDPYFATTVLPGKCRFSTMSWFDTDFEENEITEVEEIEFTLRAYDNEDWGASDFANVKITLNP